MASSGYGEDHEYLLATPERRYAQGLRKLTGFYLELMEAIQKIGRVTVMDGQPVVQVGIKCEVLDEKVNVLRGILAEIPAEGYL